MEADNSVTEVEMREVGSGAQAGLKRIRSNSEEENNSKGKQEEPKSKMTKAESEGKAAANNIVADSTKLILEKIEALNESFNHRLSAKEISTKNTEDQVNKAFLMMRKDIDDVQKATVNNAKEIQEIKEQLDGAPGGGGGGETK